MKPDDASRRSRSRRGVTSLLFIALAAQGCADFEAAVGDQSRQLLWLIVPLAFYTTIGSGFVGSSRYRQLRGWRLDVDKSDPGAQHIIRALAAFVVVACAAFGLANWQAEIASQQKLLNFGMWMCGSILGGVVALFLGLNLAK